MILHLYQQIPYIRIRLSEHQLPKAYLAVLDFLDSKETGSEACLVLDHSLTPIDCGFQTPPDDEQLRSVREMRPDKERAHDWAITPGDYQIVQFPETPDEMSIEGNLSVYVASGSLNPVYLRLIKENALVISVQALWRS